MIPYEFASYFHVIVCAPQQNKICLVNHKLIFPDVQGGFIAKQRVIAGHFRWGKCFPCGFALAYPPTSKRRCLFPTRAVALFCILLPRKVGLLRRFRQGQKIFEVSIQTRQDPSVASSACLHKSYPVGNLSSPLPFPRLVRLPSIRCPAAPARHDTSKPTRALRLRRAVSSSRAHGNPSSCDSARSQPDA